MSTTMQFKTTGEMAHCVKHSMDKLKHLEHILRTYVNASQYGCLSVFPVLGRQNGNHKANYLTR